LIYNKHVTNVHAVIQTVNIKHEKITHRKRNIRTTYNSWKYKHKNNQVIKTETTMSDVSK